MIIFLESKAKKFSLWFPVRWTSMSLHVFQSLAGAHGLQGQCAQEGVCVCAAPDASQLDTALGKHLHGAMVEEQHHL